MSEHGPRRGSDEPLPVVVVDDCRAFPPDRTEVTYARSSTAALDLLSQDRPIGQLWLDYDLGPSDTIRPVLAALEARHADVAVVIVHCSRAGAAHEIKTRLTAAGYTCQRVHSRGLNLAPEEFPQPRPQTD